VASSSTVIEEAWGRVSQEPSGETPGRFTRARFERIAQVLVGIGATVLGVQSLVVAINAGQVPEHPVLISVMFAALMLLVIGCVTGAGVRVAAGTFAGAFPLLLVWWAVVDGSRVDPEVQPWPFYLLTVATGAAMVAFPMPWQIAWAVGLPWLFANMRLIGGGWSLAVWESTVYDISIALLLGALVVVLGWMFRGIAAGVDEARAQVVETYTRARVAEAAESERIEIAALMHDSVLAALIAASRAESPRQRELAVAMAREALNRLANAESDDPEGSDEAVSVEWIAAELERGAHELGIDLHIDRDIVPDAMEIPGRAARAIVLASTQALANAVQHADAEGLAVSIRGDADGVAVAVSDAGPGLDFDEIPADRLGIRGSILARMSAAGGTADIRTGPHGTTVTVSWRGEEGAT